MKCKLIAVLVATTVVVAIVIAVLGRGGADNPAWRTRGQPVMDGGSLINTAVAMKVVIHAPVHTRPRK
jgi:hypothetical protein